MIQMFEFRSKLSKQKIGPLFTFAGLAFLVAAAVRELPVLYLFGAVAIGVGVSHIVKSK